VEVRDDPLPVAEITAWVTQPSRGAVGDFCGTVRDHSGGATSVGWFSCAASARHVVEETTVVVALSTPHRAETLEASRWCIDTVMALVPLWKREVWEGGSDCGQCSHEPAEAAKH
jgi:molybdopterin synthase catalytic subunit